MFRHCMVVLVVVLCGNMAYAQKNVVDFDLTPIFSCASVGNPSDDVAFVCAIFLEELIDDLVEAESFIDNVFAGYRDDLPKDLLSQLQPVLIQFQLIDDDGLGGNFRIVETITATNFPASGDPDWSIPQLVTVGLDAADLPFFIFTQRSTEVIVEAVLRGLGMPELFQETGLIRLDRFGQYKYFGLDGRTAGLDAYRIESDNANAESIPLDFDGRNWDPIDPTFELADGRLFDLLQFSPVSGCANNYMSNTSRAIFADLGFQVVGVNSPGIIDIDGDGKNDDPLIISPESTPLPGDVDENGTVDLLDIQPFVTLITEGSFSCSADLNMDGSVDLLDVAPFVELLLGQ